MPVRLGILEQTEIAAPRELFAISHAQVRVRRVLVVAVARVRERVKAESRARRDREHAHRPPLIHFRCDEPRPRPSSVTHVPHPHSPPSSAPSRTRARRRIRETLDRDARSPRAVARCNLSLHAPISSSMLAPEDMDRREILFLIARAASRATARLARANIALECADICRARGGFASPAHVGFFLMFVCLFQRGAITSRMSDGTRTMRSNGTERSPSTRVVTSPSSTRGAPPRRRRRAR